MKEGTRSLYTSLMVTVPKKTEAEFDFCRSMTDAEDEAVRSLLERLSAKWPLAVMQVLAEEGKPLRFSRVAERVGPISQKVLTQNLRMLEREGFVVRTLYPQVPPRVEYEITQLGVDFLVQTSPVWHWLVDRLPLFAENRRQAERAAREDEAAL